MKMFLRRLLIGMLVLGLSTVLALVLIVKSVLAPAPGEWSARVHAGPAGMQIGVPSALRMATSHWVAPHLHGLIFRTAQGPLHLNWNAPSRELEVLCAPCRLHVAALGAQPLQLAQLRLRVQRDGNELQGTLEAASATRGDAVLRGRWRGTLSPRDLSLSIDMDEAPIAHWYAVAIAGLPELAQARIGGTLALHARIELPAGHVQIEPRIAQFSVSGLGTEALLGARSACGPSAGLNTRHWLTRAVLAAEDQRFFEHPGYDLTELLAALDGNQRPGIRTRGASTLTQQLAKLLVTGSERSVQRKLRELLYAVEMEQTLGKARILSLYLDNAPWGEGSLCGAEAAARHYFQRGAQQLAPTQAVRLASMLNAPVPAAQRWAHDGSFEPKRVQRVAKEIRGVGMRQRTALLQEVRQARGALPTMPGPIPLEVP